MVIFLSLLATIVLYGNLVYYRFFSDFLTLPVLFQTGNAKDLQGSVFELVSPLDLFLLVDVMILLILYLKNKRSVVETIKYEKIGLFATALLLFLANLTIAQIERPQLLTRAFDREMLVKNIGTFNYHIYDALISITKEGNMALIHASFFCYFR